MSLPSLFETVKEAFSRSEQVLGPTAMARLRAARVLLVGVGGVGSWCAEALVRTGVGHVTIMDDDRVVASNLNRQCPATVQTLGEPKVEAMKERLLSINPACEVVARCERFTVPSTSCLQLGQRTSSSVDLPPLAFDAVVDAIDSVDCKAELILGATAAGVPIVSSMGAALRKDPTKVRVTRFEKVEGDGLAKALRQRFKKLQRFPATKFNCVWSDERPCEAAQEFRGSLMQVTATFGMCLASEVIDLLITKGETR